MNKKITIQLIIELPEDIEVEVITEAPIQKNAIESKVEVSHSTNERITLTVDEVSTLLGVSTTTVYSMCRQNEIPHKKVRGRILFHRPIIEKWLLNNEN